MKIHVEFDLTPEEFRNLMGWPDVHSWQKKMLENLDKSGEITGHDAFSTLKPLVADSMQTMEAFQKIMLEGFTQYLKAHPASSYKTGNENVKKTSESK